MPSWMSLTFIHDLASSGILNGTSSVFWEFREEVKYARVYWAQHTFRKASLSRTRHNWILSSKRIKKIIEEKVEINKFNITNYFRKGVKRGEIP